MKNFSSPGYESKSIPFACCLLPTNPNSSIIVELLPNLLVLSVN